MNTSLSLSISLFGLGLIVLWLGVRSYRLYQGFRTQSGSNLQHVKGLMYLALTWIGLVSAGIHYLGK